MTGGVSCFPMAYVDVMVPRGLAVACDSLGVRAVLFVDLPIAGLLRGTPGEFVILCSGWLDPREAVFTIAHELAHALLMRVWHPVDPGHEHVEDLCETLALAIVPKITSGG